MAACQVPPYQTLHHLTHALSANIANRVIRSSLIPEGVLKNVSFNHHCTIANTNTNKANKPNSEPMEHVIQKEYKN
ncbi:hypothetical protein LguiB_026797 [Lonicera macranthoides]